MTAQTGANGTTVTQRFRLWADRVGLSRYFAIALTVAAVAAGIATYAVLTGDEFAPDPRTVLLLLNLDLVLLLMLGVIIARRIVQLWAERRRGSAGSKLHVRLVVLFAVLAATPAVFMAVFSALFFNLGVQAWFSERVRVALSESLAVAEAYLDEHRQTIRADILAMAADLNREGPSQLANPRRFSQFINAQAAIRSLSEVVAFEGQGRVLARSGLTMSLEFEVIPTWALEKARGGELVLFTPDDDTSTSALGDRVRALIKLDRFDDVYLLVGRFVEQRVVAHVERTRQAVAEYESLEGRRSGFQITFAMIFVLVALLLLLAAVWVGLLLATKLVKPIGGLIAAAEQVRAGDLTARVAENPSDDELGLLSRAFNRMTSQLESQRRELVAANRQIDDRRRFIEAVLFGVSAGVVALDGQGRINLPNRSASLLLSADLARAIGDDFGETVPEMKPLLDQARATPDRVAENEIVVMRQGRRRSLLVRIVGERFEGETIGFVVTFDDITELEAAQRQAAWADVARRIAHEIKSDPETFRICTETIVRQVGDIGRMVDEFSSFARMPAPVMRREDLVTLVRQTVFLQRNARPEMRFVTELPETPIWLALDARQIGQAVTNLLQNAVDAIQGREIVAGREPEPGLVVVRLESVPEGTVITIEDNGKGLPLEQRERLTEPYVTTRSKGTGLGLAIVKKIMEDHAGQLILGDRQGGGASVKLVFTAHAETLVRPTESEPGIDAKKAAVHGS